jgi:hypothetical protein
LCRFIRRGLNVPHEERGHEQRGGQDKQQLDDGDGALNPFHIYFVMQSTFHVKSNELASRMN